MTVPYFEENLFQISWPAIYRQADPLRLVMAAFASFLGWSYKSVVTVTTVVSH